MRRGKRVTFSVWLKYDHEKGREAHTAYMDKAFVNHMLKQWKCAEIKINISKQPAYAVV